MQDGAGRRDADVLPSAAAVPSTSSVIPVPVGGGKTSVTLGFTPTFATEPRPGQAMTRVAPATTARAETTLTRPSFEVSR